MTAVLIILLIVPFLPSTALAAFSPAFSYFLACGAASNVSLLPDSPSRTFVPDAPFLSSAGVSAVTISNSNPASPLYAAASATGSELSYRFADPGSAAPNAFRILRLHFFPFPTAQSPVNISTARFSVSVLDAYTIISAFSPPSAGVIKEYFVPAGGSGEFRIKFTPDAGSTAFVNAIELFPAPPELLWKLSVKAVGAVDSGDMNLWAQQALETVYRLNVGGSEVTTEKDTLWRTWLPDDPYLYGPDGLSVVTNTTASIIYNTSIGYTIEVAPDSVYKTQRAMNLEGEPTNATPGPFNLTWTFPAEPGSDYLLRLHWCDYSAVSSVAQVGVVFNVYVAQSMATQNFTLKQEVTQPNEALYRDYAVTAPITGNLSVTIGTSDRRGPGEGGILNGLEIMKVRSRDLSSAGSRGRMKEILIATLSAVLGAAVVLACAVFCFFVLQRRRMQVPRPAPEKESTQQPLSPYTHDDGPSWVDMSNTSGEGGTTGGLRRVSTQLHISLAEIKAATDNFHERNLIGVGGFGDVYRGVLYDGTPVAVKRANRASKQGLPEFQTEIGVLSLIRHRHLSLDRAHINLAEWAVDLQKKGQLDKITDPRIVGQVNGNSLRKFAETADKCLAEYGLDRPSMSDVLWNLEYCLQLQEKHVNSRDAFEDSGAVATQFPADIVVPRWEPSSTSFLMDDADEIGIGNSKAFWQLSGGEGR
ncbi:hypothetical protein ABZP36_005948 [Zizania latifolia]